MADEGQALVVPQGLTLTQVEPKQYSRYKDTLGGLTDENELTVRQKLMEMNILPGGAETSDEDRMDIDREKRQREG